MANDMRFLWAILLFPLVASAQLNTNTPWQVLTYSNITDVITRASPFSANRTFFIMGRFTPNDGGGGTFIYNPASSASTNRGTVFRFPSANGRLLRQYSGSLDSRWFAVGDGVTDDYAALQDAVSLGQNLIISDKTYAISSPLSLTTQGQIIEGIASTTSKLLVTSVNGSGIINGLGPAGLLAQVTLRNFSIESPASVQTYSALDLTNVYESVIEGVYILRGDNSAANNNGWSRPLVLNQCWGTTYQNGYVRGRPFGIGVTTDGFTGAGYGANSSRVLYSDISIEQGIGVYITNCNNFTVGWNLFEGTTTNAVKVSSAGPFDNLNEHYILGNRFELDSANCIPIRLDPGSSRNMIMGNLYGSGGAAFTNNIIDLGTDNMILEGNALHNLLILKNLKIQQLDDPAAATMGMGLGLTRGTASHSGDGLAIEWFNGAIDPTRSNRVAAIQGGVIGSGGFLSMMNSVTFATNVALTNTTATMVIGTQNPPRDALDVASGRICQTYGIGNGHVWRNLDGSLNFGSIDADRATDTNGYMVLRTLMNSVVTETLRSDTNGYIEIPRRLEVGPDGTSAGYATFYGTNGLWPHYTSIDTDGKWAFYFGEPGTTVTNLFKLALDTGYTGVGNKVFTDDGTFKSLSSAGLITSGANVGGGAGVFRAVNGTSLDFNSLIGTNGTTVSSNGNVIVIDGGGGGSTNLTGTYREVYWPANVLDVVNSGSGETIVTNYTVVSTTTDLQVLSFSDNNSTGFSGYTWAPPDEWNNSFLKFKIYWTATNGTPGDVVVWAINASAQSDGDTIAVTTSTTQTDVYQGADILHVTTAITPTVSGTPATGDMLLIRVARIGTHASDNKPGPAFMLGVKAQYLENTTGAAAW